MFDKKKKKVDIAALGSSFMRIPKMDVQTARNLLDLKFKETYELRGLSPENLFEKIRKLDPKTPIERLYKIRLAIYYAENPEPDLSKLNLEFWAS